MTLLEPEFDFLPLTIFFALFLVAAFLLRSTFAWRARSRNLPLPPGPKPLLLIGNMLDLPKNKPWFRLRDMRRKYGDIVHLDVLGHHMVVLGSARVVVEYLEKRSRNSADRPPSPVVELSGQEVNFAVIRYGQWWRRHRRVFWQQFHPGAAGNYNTLQRKHAHRLLARLLQPTSGSQVVKHVRLSLSGILLELIYGIEVANENVEILPMVDHIGVAMEQASPGHFAIDVFPFLRHVPAWFPGAGFHKMFARSKAAADYLKDVPFNAVKAAMANGEVLDCVATKLLASASEDDELLRNICVVSVEGGVDTTSSALSAFFLAMALYPDVQRKAQAELEAVVGPHRLPEYSDGPALVYVNALIKELLRWHAVVPLGIPHCTLEDDEFHGYFIPAGTVLIPSVWDIMHDPEVYDSPDEFRPERFIRDGQLDPTVRDPSAFVFGFGRRFCPGRYFAHASLLIHIASVLHVFDVGPPLDDAGHPVQIKHTQGHGLLSNPEDYQCTVRPRSASAEELIALAAQSKPSASE